MCTTVEVLISAFSISAGMLSGPADLLFFRDFKIAFLTSVSVGGLTIYI